MGGDGSQVYAQNAHSGRSVEKTWRREFPGGLVVRTQRFHCQGWGSIPGLGTKIPQPSQQRKKKETGGDPDGSKEDPTVCQVRAEGDTGFTAERQPGTYALMKHKVDFLSSNIQLHRPAALTPIHTDTHVHAHTHMDARTHTHMDAWTHTQMHTHGSMDIHMNARAHTYTDAHIHGCRGTQMHWYMHMDAHTWKHGHKHECTGTHTHTHTNACTRCPVPSSGEDYLQNFEAFIQLQSFADFGEPFIADVVAAEV